MQGDIIKRLFYTGQQLTFDKNEVVLGNGHTPDGIYYIESGYVKIYSISDSGDEYLHLILGAREIFPLIWAYLGTKPEATYHEAISRCRVWRISRTWFHQAVQSNLDLCNSMSVQLAYQFQIYSDRVDNLEYKKAGERIAYRVLFLASRFGSKSGDKIIINAPVTHNMIAQSVNLARETASRHFELLEMEKIISHKQNLIVINDVQALVDKLSRPPNFLNWKLSEK